MQAKNKDVTLLEVPTGDHYDAMIDEGIPKGIEFIKKQWGAGSRQRAVGSRQSAECRGQIVKLKVVFRLTRSRRRGEPAKQSQVPTVTPNSRPTPTLLLLLDTSRFRRPPSGEGSYKDEGNCKMHVGRPGEAVLHLCVS